MRRVVIFNIIKRAVVGTERIYNALKVVALDDGWWIYAILASALRPLMRCTIAFRALLEVE